MSPFIPECTPGLTQHGDRGTSKVISPCRTGFILSPWWWRPRGDTWLRARSASSAFFFFCDSTSRCLLSLCSASSRILPHLAIYSASQHAHAVRLHSQETVPARPQCSQLISRLTTCVLASTLRPRYSSSRSARANNARPTRRRRAAASSSSWVASVTVMCPPRYPPTSRYPPFGGGIFVLFGTWNFSSAGLSPTSHRSG